jgi:hypothetical protein
MGANQQCQKETENHTWSATVLKNHKTTAAPVTAELNVPVSTETHRC